MTTEGTSRTHVVLAAADSEAFASLRRRATSRAERWATGRALGAQPTKGRFGTAIRSP